MHDDEPVVDLLDRRGRLIRFFMALAIGVGVAVAVGTTLYAWIDPARQATTGGWRFVFYMAGMSGGPTFLIAAALLTKRAQRIAKANRIPRARVV
jgi:MFS family permease